MKSTILLLFLLQTILNVVNISIAEPIHGDIFRCKKDSGTFQPNSLYKTNLMSAFKKLVNEAWTDPGFNYVIEGDKNSNEMATATFLCAGYLKHNDCVSCVNKTIPLLLQKCPDQKIAAAWRMACLVRYGPFTIKDYDIWFVANEVDKVKAKDIVGLDKALPILVSNLMKNMYNSDPKLYAYGTQPYGSPSVHVHMVLQCTLDIVSKECDTCLQHISRDMKLCCSGANAAAIITPVCYMRYAHHDFRTV